MYLSRSASLNSYAAVAMGLGLDPRAMLATVGLPFSVLANPDLKIPTRAMIELLEMSAQEARIEDFGLRMADARALNYLGPIGLAFREQPDVRRLIYALRMFVSAQVDGLEIMLEERDQLAVLSIAYHVPGAGASRQATEDALAIIARLLKRGLGPGWRPDMVLFRSPKPRRQGLHLRLFGQLPAFAQEHYALVLTQADLAAPIADTDPATADAVVRMVAAAVGVGKSGATEEVRSLIHQLLPTGNCTAEHIAAILGVDRRTIHRHLSREGTSFMSILDGMRLDKVHTFHSEGRSVHTDVAGQLGFSCLSAYSRWRKHKGVKLD